MLTRLKLTMACLIGLVMIAHLSLTAAWAEDDMRGTGDLGVVIERADGSVLIVETTTQEIVTRIEGLGDLSHASVVFSRDGRYGYVFGRDGGLTKIDLLKGAISKRIVQSGNSIGGAISQDGKYVAVSNYEPGGVRVFDSETLELVADIPSGDGDKASKVVGLVDAPGNKFVFTLYDEGQIWIADLSKGAITEIRKITDVGKLPYDALITPNGRFYVAGLFGEDGFALVDLWASDPNDKRILQGYGRGSQPLPVYKMPHLEGWGVTDNEMLLPAVGRHKVIVVDRNEWQEIGQIPVHGQPIFVMARPDGRHVWVNFAIPDNDTVQVIDVRERKIIKTLKPGEAILHMEFTPRGEHVWVSSRDSGKIVIYDTETFEVVKELPAQSPSGIFFTSRANKIGL